MNFYSKGDGYMNKKIKGIIIFVGIIMLLIGIDFISILTLNKPLFAIKEDNGDSVNLIYRGILYDVYDCYEYSSVQIKAKGTKFTCSALNKEASYMVTEVQNVSISIFDISKIGATIVIKDTNMKPYIYEEWYKIEKEIDGEWYRVDTIIDSYGFNEIGYVPNKDGEVKFIINWEKLYGELSSGSYRILKRVNNKYISVPFNIEEFSNSSIEVVKPELYNAIKFNKYLERDNRVIYLAGNIEEVYYKKLNTKYRLKEYITNILQSIDDGINELTKLIMNPAILNDGGTEIYKSKEYDITIVCCNTLSGNKDIFIGDYLMGFDSKTMCK